MGLVGRTEFYNRHKAKSQKFHSDLLWRSEKNGVGIYAFKIGKASNKNKERKGFWGEQFKSFVNIKGPMVVLKRLKISIN